MAQSKYRRILLKLSGESLQGKQNYGHDVEVLRAYAEQIKRISELGVEIGIVIGGGNIFRGIQGAGRGFDRVKGDQMGQGVDSVESFVDAGQQGCVLLNVFPGANNHGNYFLSNL